MQLNLFDSVVLEAVGRTGTLKGAYRSMGDSLGLTPEQFKSDVKDLGKWGVRSKWEHRVRSIMHRLKSSGLVDNGKRTGEWVLTEQGRKAAAKNLSFAPQNQGLKVAFVTKSGMAFFGDGANLADLFPGEVQLIWCSPPYLTARSYGHLGGGGKPTESEYVDQMVRMVESWLPMLTPSGAICLNLGAHGATRPNGEIDMTHMAVVLALREKLGLKMVNQSVTYNRTRPPSGAYTTGVGGCPKLHFVNKVEHIYVLAVDLEKLGEVASTTRALVPYSDAYKKEIERRNTKGAISTRRSPSGQGKCQSSYAKDLGGSIPGNMIEYRPEGANSPWSQKIKEAGLPRHPAMAAREIIEPFVKTYSTEGSLVADPCFGSGLTGKVAEDLGRSWIGSDVVLEYLQGASLRFA